MIQNIAVRTPEKRHTTITTHRRKLKIMPAVLALQERFNFTSHAESPPLFYIHFFILRADGRSLDDKRSEVKENDIPDIIARFKNLEAENDRKRTDQSFFVEKQEIVDNAYDLSINKYKEIEYIPVEYPPTSEIMANLRALEKEVQESMAELEKMLGDEMA